MQNVNTIEKLLNDELSAIETYQKALDETKFPGGQFMSNSLMPMFKEHKEAASALQEQVVKLGGTTLKNPALWGTWSKLVSQNGNLLGQRPAILVLFEGEKTAEAHYLEALNDPTLSPDIRALIETKLLPTQQAHIRSLDRVLEKMPA